MMGDVDRYARILRVLAKHGFVVLDQEVVHHHDCDEVRAAQLRIALEELGTLFIKLGQFVASQSVALPQPYRVELASSRTISHLSPRTGSRR